MRRCTGKAMAEEDMRRCTGKAMAEEDMRRCTGKAMAEEDMSDAQAHERRPGEAMGMREACETLHRQKHSRKKAVSNAQVLE
jgi:hypothetical protein